MRGGHAGAALVSISIGLWHRQAAVTERVHRRAIGSQARVAGIGERAATAAGRTDRDFGPDVRVIGAVAIDGMRSDRDDAAAIGRLVHRVIAAVTGRDDDHRAARIDVVDGALERGGTSAAAAKRQIDHARRVRVVRYAGDVDAGRPAHRINDVGRIAAAAPEHTQGQQTHAGRDTGAIQAVVHQCRDGTHHMRAMPAGIGRGRAAAAGSGRCVVADIGGIGIAAIAVERDCRTADEVITGQHRLQIGMRSVSCVDHGDGHIATAQGHVPGAGQIGAAAIEAGWRVVIPLTR